MAAYRGRSTWTLDHMSRKCPNCQIAIPSLRGLVVRSARPAGSSWFRYSRRRFYCQRCDAELSYEISPVGYFLNVAFVLAAVALAAYGRGLIPFLPKSIASGPVELALLVGIFPIAVLYAYCLGRWGVTWRRAL